MTATTLLALFTVWMAAITSPGPDSLQIVRVGSRHRQDGVWTAAGILLGNTIWITASLLGLSALISTHPAIISVLQVVGGSYLTWMGTQSVRSWWRQRGVVASISKVSSEGESLGPWRALRLGVATHLSNPKAVLFFGSVFAQFIKPDMGIEISIFIALFLIVTGAMWFFGFALAVRKLSGVLVRYSGVIDLVSGLIFMALGVFMVWQGLTG